MTIYASKTQPRPEYDHAQHNPPNPVLVDIRKYRAERALMNNPKGWAHVLRRFESATRVYPGNPWDATPDQIDHARRVLSRLANLEDYA